jgi:hypothetical protein
MDPTLQAAFEQEFLQQEEARKHEQDRIRAQRHRDKVKAAQPEAPPLTQEELYREYVRLAVDPDLQANYLNEPASSFWRKLIPSPITPEDMEYAHKKYVQRLARERKRKQRSFFCDGRRRPRKRKQTSEERLRFVRAKMLFGIKTLQDLDDHLRKYHLLTPEFKFIYGLPLTEAEQQKLGEPAYYKVLSEAERRLVKRALAREARDARAKAIAEEVRARFAASENPSKHEPVLNPLLPPLT